MSIIFCLSSWDIYLFLGISFATVSELFCCELFDILSLYYFNLSLSIIFLSSFWRYIFFFRNLFIMLICNCFWIILLWTFWSPRNFISNFITNQITSCFNCFLNCSFWISFKRICSRLFNMIKKFLMPVVRDLNYASLHTWTIFTALPLLLIFLPIILPIFLAKNKN